MKKFLAGLLPTILFWTLCMIPASAQPRVSDPPLVRQEPAAESGVSQFGGPSSVGGTIVEDEESQTKHTLIRIDALNRLFDPYFDFKSKVQKEYGFAFGFDYQALFQVATASLGEDLATGGVVRFFGRWILLGRDSKHTGTFVYKVENRHLLGADIPPQGLGSAIGYAGLTAVPFSDIGWALTNLYWEQRLWNNLVAFVFGVVDTTDYVDTYSLVDPWSDFNNLAFSTDPTIPAPDQGLGAAARILFMDHFYMLGGLADANGDPTDSLEGFHTFFEVAEYFSHLEIGWVASYDRRFTDNVHLTAWYVDPRKEKQVPSGWGLAFSMNFLVAETWQPFVRAGYADRGDSLWEGSVSIGLGYHLRRKSDLLALGLNWGRPSKVTFGPGLNDQYTMEVFYRVQLLRVLTLTPDVQILINPALNPDEDLISVFSIRGRLSF